VLGTINKVAKVLKYSIMRGSSSNSPENDKKPTNTTSKATTSYTSLKNNPKHQQHNFVQHIEATRHKLYFLLIKFNLSFLPTVPKCQRNVHHQKV
jgi:hypothetical protein